jgi:hypothetical protein
MKSPRGNEIIGTYENLNGCSKFMDAKIVDGKIVFDYTGDTEVYWDAQKTNRDESGKRIFVDEKGFMFSEDEVIAANK